MIKGVDISVWQGGIDYYLLKKEGIRFAIIRAGVKIYEDSELENHIKGCNINGIDYGFYWYCHCMSVVEAETEAKKCIEVLNKYDKPKYPVFFDMEEKIQIEKLDTKTRTDIAEAFCKTIESGGYPCGVYANPSWLENYYDKTRLIDKYDIWLAHWTDNPNRPSKYDYGQTLWQWGLDGIGGMDVDGNVCFIDYPARTADWYKKHGITTDNSKPEASSEPQKPEKFKVGDKVRVKSGANFSDGTKPFAEVYKTEYEVMQISRDGTEALIGVGGEYTGWMFVADLCIPDCNAGSDNKPEQNLKIGDTVKVKAGAATYNGKPLALFVYTQKYTVMQVGKTGADDYIVIGQNGDVTAAVKAENLILQ